MKLKSIACGDCGHEETFHLPRFPKPGMTVWCTSCKQEARLIWEEEKPTPRFTTMTWMTQEGTK